MSFQSKNIYAIVVTYNGMKWIQKCIDSLVNSKIKLTLIVVDNCSYDGTVDFIVNNYPYIKLIKLNDNLGFAVANNIAFEYVIKKEPDYIFLLNQDAWIESNTIFELISGFTNHSNFGILCPIQLNGDNTGLDFNFSMQLNRDNCPFFVSDLYYNHLKKVYEINFSNAASWLIDVNCYLRVGKFDPIFRLYGEDDNYIQRVHFHSLKIGLVPSAIVYHDREYRVGKKSPSSLFYEEKVDVLNILLNINTSFVRSFFFAFYYIIKSISRKLFELNICGIYYDIKITLFVLMNFMLLLNRRKKYVSGHEL